MFPATETKHWRGFQGKNGPQATPVLEFPFSAQTTESHCIFFAARQNAHAAMAR